MVGSFQNGDVKYFCRGDDVVVGTHAMLRIRVVYLRAFSKRNEERHLEMVGEPTRGGGNQPKAFLLEIRRKRGLSVTD